jgi:hypothetical protein
VVVPLRPSGKREVPPTGESRKDLVRSDLG